jgi:type III restriction enzyme
VSKVLGVPFEVIPFKATSRGPSAPRVKRYHVHAVPEKAEFEIRFPRVEGYTQAIRNRVTMDWDKVPKLVLQPDSIPPQVEVKGLSVNNAGRLSLMGPGRLDEVSLREYRAKRRVQELVFDLAKGMTKHYVAQPHCQAPAHVLFPQLVQIIDRYLKNHVEVRRPADIKDLGLSPYYGWLVEILSEHIHPDTSGGETPEIPLYESSRGPGSTADVDFWTSREPREVIHSHLNYVVPDTAKWEQAAAYYIDTHPMVEAFVKNASLGFAIPYLYNGQMHDYLPDFIVRLKTEPSLNLILETKGYDPLAEVKFAAAERWVNAVNAEGSHGRWSFAVAKKTTEVASLISAAASEVTVAAAM